MVNACADPDFFVREERGGGGGSKPNGDKTALIFYVCFGILWSKIFRGGGGSNYLRGGSQC